MKENISEINKMAFGVLESQIPTDVLKDLEMFEAIIIQPKKFFGKTNPGKATFAKLDSLVRSLGGEYIKGKNKFILPLKSIVKAGLEDLMRWER